MHNQKQVAVSDLYLNPSSLKISGDKIKLQKFPHEAKPNYNVKQISLTPSQPAPRDSHIRPTDCFANRQTYKVSVKNYTNRDVHNKQLKQIYEAVEFDDFKRFLLKNPVARKNVPNTVSLSTIDTKNFYHDNFEVHYNFLKNIIRKNLQCPKQAN